MSRFLENSTWHKVVSEEQRYLIQIVMTEHCNLSCSYCYQSHRGKKDIDYPRVRATLLYTLKAINGAKRITIHFFGGEPLMAFENIIRLTEDAQQFWEEHDWPSTGLVFGIVTNGTLLSSEMKRWLEQHPNVSLFLSLDGTAETHNANRCGSYSSIEPNLPFFRRYGNPVKMTIGPNSISQCAAGIKHIHSLGFECQANLVFEDVWGSNREKAEYVAIFSNQLAVLLAFYKAHPEITRSTLIPPLTVSLPSSDQSESWGLRLCGMGRNMTTIGVDGMKYPCHRVIPFCKEGNSNDIEIERVELKPDSCSNCKLQPMCPECRAYNFEYHGDTNFKTTFHCEFTQCQLRASALLTFYDVLRIRSTMDLDKLTLEDKLFLSQRLNTAIFVEEHTRKLHDDKDENRELFEIMK
jgi:radical SAM protein with 4Fe4S-binding SPASM domain